MSKSLGQPGYTELKHVVVDDIYGDGWWSRNSDELNRRFDWAFRYAVKGELILQHYKLNVGTAEPFHHNRSFTPLIVVLAEKPQSPTLRDIYGVDEVTIPTGWEWTGEFRVDKKAGESWLTSHSLVLVTTVNYDIVGGDSPRLILRKRAPKVWFKAERITRKPRFGEWIFVVGTWVTADIGQLDNKYLCATRHEEPDLTTQTVTQADIDRLQKENN